MASWMVWWCRLDASSEPWVVKSLIGIYFTSVLFFFFDVLCCAALSFRFCFLAVLQHFVVVSRGRFVMSDKGDLLKGGLLVCCLKG